jgi:peptidoglycan/LPS O-acetylase OafA/YrhL
MSEPSIIPCVLLMLFYLACAHLFVGHNRFYGQITSTSGDRYESLDGLRGFLALGVFFHHAVLTQAAYITGKWSSVSGLYGALGPVSVAFFFMITGFLFWSKAINNHARVNAFKLWKNRLWRIAPMCLFSVVAMLAIVAAESGFQLRQPLVKLIPRVLACLSLGTMLPEVNGVSLNRINAYVFWTLRYEWWFYISLPLFAWFATPKRLVLFSAAVVPLGLLAGVYCVFEPKRMVFFLIGIIAAQLVGAHSFRRHFRSRATSLLAIGSLCIVAAAVEGAFWSRLALSFVVFMAIAYDSDLFWFLRWRATKFLGTISYSIYLMHAIVLFVVFGVVNQNVSVATLSPYAFWTISCGCGLLIIFISAVTYRFVEHPFLNVKARVDAPISLRVVSEPSEAGYEEDDDADRSGDSKAKAA